MPTGSRKEVAEQEEIPSLKAKFFRVLGITLFVIAGLAVVYFVSFIGDFSDSSEKISSTLNTVAESEPFWGGIGFVLGGIGWFFIAIAAVIIAGIAAIIIAAIFGVGLIASSVSADPEKRTPKMAAARSTGILLLLPGIVAAVLIVPLVILDFLDRPPKPSVEEVYVNGQLNRVVTEWRSKGQKSSEKTYVNGKQEGVSTSWHVNGQKWRETTYVNGEREGVSISWNNDGLKASETTYVNDQPKFKVTWSKWGGACARSKPNYVNVNGTRVDTEWYRSGQQCTEENYVNGKREGVSTRWHENGQKQFEENYVNGNKEGVSTWWDENGQKRSEENYVNGKVEGVSTTWYYGGQKRSEEDYVNGKLEGVSTRWDENGQKRRETTYVNGIEQ